MWAQNNQSGSVKHPEQQVKEIDANLASVWIQERCTEELSICFKGFKRLTLQTGVK